MFSGKIVPFKLSDRGLCGPEAEAGGDNARYVTRGQWPQSHGARHLSQPNSRNIALSSQTRRFLDDSLRCFPMFNVTSLIFYACAKNEPLRS